MLREKYMKNVLLYLETEEGYLSKSSKELIVTASNIFKNEEYNLMACTINAKETNNIKEIAPYRIKKYFRIQHQLLENYSIKSISYSIRELCVSENIDIIIFATTAKEMELAPYIATILNAGYLADCVSLEFKTNLLIAKRHIYGGKILAQMQIKTEKQVYSLRVNSTRVDPTRVDSTEKQEVNNNINLENINFIPQLSDIKNDSIVVETKLDKSRLNISDANIVVSGGKGMQEANNFKHIEILAEKLNGAVGASRAVVDAGWRPQSEQVGQTGKTISPNIYIALGISGAIQHVAGISTSKKIIAINKDENAPIFSMCDYGIVADILEILPKINKMI